MSTVLDNPYAPLVDPLLQRVRRAAEKRIEAEDEFVEAIREAYRQVHRTGSRRFTGQELANAALVSRQRIYQIVSDGPPDSNQKG